MRKSTTDSWRVDETYIKVKKQWVYLYRAVDSQGHTLDFFLSPMRDVKAAKAFLLKTLTASHTSSPRVINVDKKVVLQKLEEKKWGVEWSSQACLDGYAEQFGDQRDLPSYISFCQSSQLPFSHHVHHLKPRYRFAMPSQRRKSPFQALSSV